MPFDPERWTAAHMNARLVCTVPETPDVTMTPKQAGLAKAAVLGCTRCELRRDDVDPEPVRGPILGRAKFTLVSASPTSEDLQTRRFLSACIEKAGFRSRDVAWLTTVACPSDMPKDKEIIACRVHFDSQMTMTATRILLLVGGTVTKQWTSVPITNVAGHWGVWNEYQRVVVPILHPKTVLAGGARNKRQETDRIVGDLLLVRQVLEGKVMVSELLGRTCVMCGSDGVVDMDELGLGWCREHGGKGGGVKMKWAQGRLGV